ncbi:hypothetical protein HDU67_007324 [Dinochytrium kinnereticum]|nr:hypothetical protein HDU67_007324 [Dinochytrium kinnereticum]
MLINLIPFLALLHPTIVTAFTTPIGFTMEAAPSTVANSLTVTIRGTLPADQWVGFGVPDQTTQGMLNADLFIAHVDNGNVVVVGGGTSPTRKSFVAGSEAVQVLSAVSNYTNGIITASFTLPTILPSNRDLTTVTSFLYATGAKSASGFAYHSTNRGVITNARLLVSNGASTTSAVPGSTSATSAVAGIATSAPSGGASSSVAGAASTTTSKPSGARRDAVGVVGMVLGGVLMGVLGVGI